MDIYERDDTSGVLDLGKAIAELRATGPVTNADVKRGRLGEIQAAALLDIAGSLRVLAAEAASAMPALVSYAEGYDDETGRNVDAPRDFLVNGDVVAMRDTGEVVGTVEEFGYTEGESYVIVDGQKVWEKMVERVIDTEPVGIEPESPAEATIDEPEDDVTIEVEDEIDDDFGTALDELDKKPSKKRKATS